MTNRIFAGDMWVGYNFGDPNKRYQNFLLSAKPKFERFFDSLLLYDEVVLPTDDFMSLAVLVGVLGIDPVLALVETGSLKIVRTKGFLAYVGNGGGLLGSTLLASDKRKLPVSGHMDETLYEIMIGIDNVDNNAAQRLTDAILPVVREKALSVDDQFIRTEIYRDILESDTLRATFANADLSRLPGIGPRDVRVYDMYSEPTANEDKISLLLRLAQATLEMHLASFSDCRDISTSNPIERLLNAKRQREKSTHSAMFRLKELAEIPTTVDWVLESPQRLEKLLKLRETSSGKAFRDWMHNAVGDENDDIAKSYVSLLRNEPSTKSLPARVVRFLATSGWAAIEPITGTAAAIFDGFLADKFLATRSPKFFIDRLAGLPKSKRTLGTK